MDKPANLYLPNLLLVGGATRNVGKTTLTKNIVKHFSEHHQIIGLKIKTLRTGDDKFHGKGRHELIGNYLVVEESYDNKEDTGAIYHAGAKQSFHIKTKHSALLPAFSDFLHQIDYKNQLIVCESNSIREVVQPGVFLMIKHKNTPDILKPSAEQLSKFSDQVVWTDGAQHSFQPSELYIENLMWKITHK